MDGQAKMRVQIICEPAHLFRLDSLRAAQAQRQPDHNLPDVVFREHLSQGLQIVTFVPPLDRIQPLRGDPQRVRDGNPNSFRANIQGHDAPMADHPRCIHPSIVDCEAPRVALCSHMWTEANSRSPLCSPVNPLCRLWWGFWNQPRCINCDSCRICNSNSAIPAPLGQNCCPVRSGEATQLWKPLKHVANITGR